MKKIIMMTTIMTLMLTASAFAGSYKCVCIGKPGELRCGDNFLMASGTQDNKQLNISNDAIKHYMSASDLPVLKNDRIHYSKYTGWVCASY